jgi:hypothetical protein
MRAGLHLCFRDDGAAAPKLKRGQQQPFLLDLLSPRSCSSSLSDVLIHINVLRDGGIGGHSENKEDQDREPRKLPSANLQAKAEEV